MPGSYGTVANGLNALGQIVGGYFDSSGIEHGFLYYNGKFTTLNDPLATGTYDFAEGINDHGQIVGSYSDASGVEHGYLYKHGHYTTLDDPIAGDQAAKLKTFSAGNFLRMVMVCSLPIQSEKITLRLIGCCPAPHCQTTSRRCVDTCRPRA